MNREAPQFSPLTPSRPRRRMGSFLAGLAVNLGLVSLLAMVHFTPALRPKKNLGGILLAPVPVSEPAPKPLPKRAVKLPPVPKVQEPSIRVETPVLVPPPPVIAAQPQPQVKLPQPVTPRPPAVVTGAFSAATASPAPAAAPPPPAVATGSFSAPASGGTNIKPSAPAVAPAGFGAATTGTLLKNEASRLASSAGFGSAGTGTYLKNEATKPAAASAGFEAAQVAATRRYTAAPTTATTFQSVEIIAKPKPEYTAEARQLRIEGEVWLEVLFAADGTARIQRVVRSLGHGLDENAIAATRRIRFRPAHDGARPIDQLATLRVQFQLAE